MKYTIVIIITNIMIIIVIIIIFINGIIYYQWFVWNRPRYNFLDSHCNHINDNNEFKSVENIVPWNEERVLDILCLWNFFGA